MTAAPLAPAVWGIGRVAAADGPLPWPVAAADIDDEAASMAVHLDSLGIGPDRLLLLVAMLSATIHAAPLEIAAGQLGALYSCADATPNDAFRVRALVASLHPQAVVGVGDDVVSGLVDAGVDVGTVFAGVPEIVTTDETAHAALTDAGLRPRRWLRLGPTSAFECAARAGAHLDASRWRADESADGEIVVTSLVPRLTPARQLRTGIAGRVDSEPCGCGRTDPRIV